MLPSPPDSMISTVVPGNDSLISVTEPGPITSFLVSTVPARTWFWKFTSVSTKLIATDVLVEGETATWKCGVNPSGLMWIKKNDVIVAEKTGVVPAKLARKNKYVGESNWDADTPLIGKVSFFKLVNEEAPAPEPVPEPSICSTNPKFNKECCHIDWGVWNTMKNFFC